MSQVAGSIASASPPKGGKFSQVAAATAKPVPESAPPSPGGSEAGMASIMKRLAHLEECNRLGNAALEKSEKDNARLERSLREALQQHSTKKKNGKKTHLKSTKPQRRQRRNPSLGKPGRRRLRCRT